MKRALLCALLLGASSAAANPIAPGPNPLELGPPGLELQASAGAPGSGLGLEARTRLPFAAALELGAVIPGALRPEASLRFPFSLGPVRLAPRIAVAYSAPFSDFTGMPSAREGELQLAACVGLPLHGWSLFADVGSLALWNFAEKQKARIYGTAALGAGLSLGSFDFALHVGSLYNAYRFSPAAGLAAGWHFFTF